MNVHADTAANRPAGSALAWIAPSAISVLIYPFLLSEFHLAVKILAPQDYVLAALSLLLAFGVAAVCMLCATRLAALGSVNGLRFACLGVAAPTIYVFMGVLTYMAGSRVPDQLVWIGLWILLAYLVLKPERTKVDAQARPNRLRYVHGITAAILAVYVLFHLANHLFGLLGPEWHRRVMEIGRTVYRAHAIEPLLVAAMIFQVVTGIGLFGRWTSGRLDAFRVFQVASGLYLAIFILGHMNSVFIFARRFLGIETDWSFATGGAAGLVFDPWNIRLIPHYWLGTFFVLTHLAAGARVVLAAHGVNQATVAKVWYFGLAASAVIATGILLGMCGLRI